MGAPELGLAISKQLAELMGGEGFTGERIWGGKYVLLYEQRSASTTEVLPQQVRASMSDLQQKSVLVVDDSSSHQAFAG